MELRHLRYFLGVADTLHYGRAARRLAVSQPTLSQQMRQLEDELGAPLFERRGRGIVLSRAGEIFRVFASRTVEDATAGARAVQAMTGLGGATLRVAYLPSLRGLVVPSLAAMMKRDPSLRVAAREALVRSVERRVADGSVDVGVALASTRTAGLEVTPLRESRIALVVGARHRLAGESRVAIDALADEPFALLRRGLRLRATVDAYLASTRLAPRIVFEADAIGAVLGMVESNAAITLLALPFAQPKGVAVVDVTPRPPAQLVALLFRAGAVRTLWVDAFAGEIGGERG